MGMGKQGRQDGGIANYKEPVIPGWSPYGSMKPGLGGANCGNRGSQNGPNTGDGAGGYVGIKGDGGEGRGMGTNRKG